MSGSAMRITRFLSATAFTFVAFAALASAEKRVALVIGESAYAHANLLQNPKNDANAIGGMLRVAAKTPSQQA